MYRPFKRTALFVLVACSMFLCSYAQPQAWQVAPHTRARFVIGGPMGKVHGSIELQNAVIAFDRLQPEKGTMEVTLDVATIKTGIRMRDRHLLKSDFFDVKKYPVISFHATSIQALEAPMYQLNGLLTIRDVTLPVTIPFSVSVQKGETVFAGRFSIRRLDYNVGRKYKRSIGKEVQILLYVPVTPV